MNKLRYIEVERLEGPIALTGRKHRFKSVSEANSYLRSISHTVSGYGYDKTRVRIGYGKRDIYEGRFDVTRAGEDTDIVSHLRRIQKYYGGRHPNLGHAKGVGNAAGRVARLLSSKRGVVMPGHVKRRTLVRRFRTKSGILVKFKAANYLRRVKRK